MTTEKYCPNCNEFKENIEKIDSAIMLAWTHGMWGENKNISFKFCPYCGSELKEL